MDKKSKIYIAGHRGMVGSAIVRTLVSKGYENILVRTHNELDLTNQHEVDKFFEEEKPECVILSAAKVGGIGANIKSPVEFLMTNLQIQSNVITSSYKHGISKLLFLGSSCIYPKDAQQPLKEEYLLSGFLEPTNEGYAIAKIAGLKACEYYSKQYGVNYISIMPCNLYGTNDNFDINNAHMVAALIRRMHEAKENDLTYINIWGSGNQYREIMHVDDLSDAAVFLLENYNLPQFINVGTGSDNTVKEIASIIKKIVGYNGELLFDTTKPDGMFRKVLDVTKLNNLGWHSKISLEDGIRDTYKWYLSSLQNKNI